MKMNILYYLNSLGSLITNQRIKVELKKVESDDDMFAYINLETYIATIGVSKKQLVNEPELIVMLLSHEMHHAHANINFDTLKSRSEAAGIKKEMFNIFAQFFNIIEDVRIDRINNERFPGWKAAFDKFYKEQSSSLQANLDAADKGQCLGGLKFFSREKDFLGKMQQFDFFNDKIQTLDKYHEFFNTNNSMMALTRAINLFLELAEELTPEDGENMPSLDSMFEEGEGDGQPGTGQSKPSKGGKGKSNVAKGAKDKPITTAGEGSEKPTHSFTEEELAEAGDKLDKLGEKLKEDIDSSKKTSSNGSNYISKSSTTNEYNVQGNVKKMKSNIIELFEPFFSNPKTELVKVKEGRFSSKLYKSASNQRSGSYYAKSKTKLKGEKIHVSFALDISGSMDQAEINQGVLIAQTMEYLTKETKGIFDFLSFESSLKRYQRSKKGSIVPTDLTPQGGTALVPAIKACFNELSQMNKLNVVITDDYFPRKEKLNEFVNSKKGFFNKTIIFFLRDDMQPTVINQDVIVVGLAKASLEDKKFIKTIKVLLEGK